MRLALLLTLGGCASFNEMLPDEDSSQYEPLQLDYSVPPSTGGGLFRSGYSGSLTGDKRAVRVGDILTVVLDESTQSSKSAGTSFGKSSGVSVGIPTVLGNTYDRLESSAEAERDFNGSARSSQQNTLRGAIAGVNDAQQKSGALAKAFELGEPGADLAKVMVASQQSQIAFRATVEVRNRLVQAYQDVMNMPL